MPNVPDRHQVEKAAELVATDPAAMLLARHLELGGDRRARWRRVVDEVERLTPELGRAMAAGVVLAKLNAGRL